MPRVRLLIACLALLAGPLAAPARAIGGGWDWPVAGELVTTYRNASDPYAAGQHRGVDIAAPAGTPVVAAAAGTVRFAGVAGSSGLTVSVRTADGRFDTSYLHLSDAAVSEGASVQAGERLGAVGTSGRRSTPVPHLHFGVREAGTRHAYVDPLTLLGPVPRPTPPEAPRVAPAPVPAPAPPALSPVRVPGPVRLPAARHLRLPVASRAPMARSAPTPGSSPAPGAASAAAPALRPLTALGRASGKEGGHRTPALERPDAPSLGPRAPVLPAPAPAAGPTPVGVPSRTGGHGPDVGWALACGGLLLAAGLTGRARGGSRGPKTSPGRRRPAGRRAGRLHGHPVR